MSRETDAHQAVSRAVRGGLLARATGQACRTCGGPAEVLHHWSYDPAHHLDVVPLCRSCHVEVHLGHRPDPTSGETWRRVRRPREATPTVLHRRELYGAALKSLRERGGLTMQAAADRAGMSRAHWDNVESGWQGVNEATLTRMVEAIGGELRLALVPA